MERNKVAGRNIWDRQHAWLLLSFSPFPVGQTIYAHCTLTSGGGALKPDCVSDLVGPELEPHLLAPLVEYAGLLGRH